MSQKIFTKNHTQQFVLCICNENFLGIFFFVATHKHIVVLLYFWILKWFERKVMLTYPQNWAPIIFLKSRLLVWYWRSPSTHSICCGWMFILTITVKEKGQHATVQVCFFPEARTTVHDFFCLKSGRVLWSVKNNFGENAFFFGVCPVAWHYMLQMNGFQ